MNDPHDISHEILKSKLQSIADRNKRFAMILEELKTLKKAISDMIKELG